MTTEEFIMLIASLVAGILGMPITKYFKEKLNLDSTSSLALSVADVRHRLHHRGGFS